MKKVLWLCVLLGGMLWQGRAMCQQLPQYSQYMFNGLYVNPGYAGYKGEPYLQATYRSQWVGFPGAPRTFSFSADLSANEGRMGFGLSLFTDALGPATTNNLLGTYAYRIRTGRDSQLGLGISAGVSEYVIDGSALDPNDFPDVDIPQGRVNLFTPTLNAGVFFTTTRFYAGLSAYNMVGKKSLEREDVSLAYHDFHYYLTAGWLLPVSESVQLKPSFLIKEVKGAPTNYDVNLMLLFFERIWLGASYRSNFQLWKDNLPENLNNRNAVAFLMEFFATDQLRIGYAYDHNLSGMDSFRNQSHEISLGYYISPKIKRLNNQRWF